MPPPPRRLARPPRVLARLGLHLAVTGLLGAVAYYIISLPANTTRWGGRWSATAATSIPEPVPVRICSEECGVPYSRNGMCDDGRPEPSNASAYDGTVRQVLCDLGTDCADCGAFETPAGEAARWRPVAEIRRRKFAIFTRQAEAPFMPFYMAYTNPE